MRSRVDDGACLTRRTLLAMAAIAPALTATGMTGAAESRPTETAGLPPDLAKAVNEYDQATVRNDIATLGDLVAEDYMLVNSDSSVQNKQEYLADFTVPGFRLDPYVLEQSVFKVWEDTALLGGLLLLSWTQDGQQQKRLLRIAHVWARDEGHWRMKYTQLTRVPQ